MNDTMKIVQTLEDFNTLLKRVTKTNKNETKEQKGGILGMLLGDLGASLLGNMLAETGMFRAGPSYPLTDFEIQNNYQNESRFNGVFSRDNLPNIVKKGAYGINLDECAYVGTHWIALFCTEIEVTYFDSFGVEHIPDEIKEFIGNRNLKANIFRIQ